MTRLRIPSYSQKQILHRAPAVVGWIPIIGASRPITHVQGCGGTFTHHLAIFATDLPQQQAVTSRAHPCRDTRTRVRYQHPIIHRSGCLDSKDNLRDDSWQHHDRSESSSHIALPSLGEQGNHARIRNPFLACRDVLNVPMRILNFTHTMTKSYRAARPRGW